MRALNNLLPHYTDHFYLPGPSLPLTSRSKMFRFIVLLALGFLCLTSSSQAHKKVKRHMYLFYISLFPIQLLSRIRTPCNVVCFYQANISIFCIPYRSSPVKLPTFLPLSQGQTFLIYKIHLGHPNCLQIGNFHAMRE